MRSSSLSTAAAEPCPGPERSAGVDPWSLAQAGSVRWDDGPSWGAWSRASVRLMRVRNATLVRDLGLRSRSQRWQLDSPWMVIESRHGGRVVADVCVIGSSSPAGTFRWAWASNDIPAHARGGMERVREFGEMNGLDPMTAPECPASRAQAIELAAVAARLLNASGLWVESAGERTIFLALSGVRRA
jgi:hypothetical protein